jgi:hypothetical protein
MKTIIQHIRNYPGLWVASVMVFFLSLFVFHEVLIFVELSEGIVFNDPLFPLFVASDYSPIIFFLTYGSLLSFLIATYHQPFRWPLYMQGYAVMVFLRAASVFLFPLAEPPGAVPLNDPVLSTFFYPGGYTPRDLFFSGHVGTILLFAWLTPQKVVRLLLLLVALVTGVLLVLQKVHYSIDVLAAPVLMIPVFLWIRKRILKPYPLERTTFDGN